MGGSTRADHGKDRRGLGDKISSYTTLLAKVGCSHIQFAFRSRGGEKTLGLEQCVGDTEGQGWGAVEETGTAPTQDHMSR